MKKLFLLAFLFFYLRTIQCSMEFEVEDDFTVMKAYHHYLNHTSKDSFSNFKIAALQYYEKSPLNCLGLLKKYKKDWTLKEALWVALMEKHYSYTELQFNITV